VRRRSAELWTYFVGVVLLGLSYSWLKSKLPWYWFLIVAIVYLVALRILGRVLAGRKAIGGNEDAG
jgi:hypothetical protein